MAWLERPGQHLLMWDGPGYPPCWQKSTMPRRCFSSPANCLARSPSAGDRGQQTCYTPGARHRRAFSRYLAQAGFTITSGLAVGVDGAAHRAALQAGGCTIAVLGTGLQKLYPQRHRDLAQAMIDNGSALVSEYLLDAGPLPGNFPGATASSVACRWACWWSRRASPAAR
jgi:DNA processing protein